MNRTLPLLCVVFSLSAARPAAAQVPLREVNHDGPALAVAFSPDGKLLASGGQDGTLRITDVATGKEARRFPFNGGVKAIAFSPDGKLLAVKAEGESLAVHDAVSGKMIRSQGKVPVWQQYAASHVAFTADGKTVIACAVGERITWQHTTGGASGSRQGKPPAGGYAAVAPGGSHTAWGYPNGQLQIYDADMRKFQTMQVGPATAVAFTADGKSLASANADKVIRIWPLAGTAAQRRLEGFDQPVGRLAFNRDGKVLAAAAAAAPEVRVWDVERGRPRRRLTGLRDAVNDLVLSADGKTLVTADRGGKVQLWNVALRDIERPKEFVALQEAELRRLWDDLASADHDRAEAAYRKLASGGDLAVPLLKGLVRKVAIPDVDFKRLEKLVLDLDATAYAVRQRAFAELSKYGELAEKRLREVLAGKPSLELERRAKQLLEQLKEPALTADRVRALEVIELLEWLNTPESRRALEEIAREGLIARLRNEAATSLRRLAPPGKG